MSKFRASFHHEPAAKRVADIDPAATVQLTIVLHPAASLDAATHTGGPGISRETYRALHATKDAAMQRVRTVAHRFGLTIVHEDASAHVIKLRGTYAQAIAAFQPEHIGLYDNGAGGTFVGRSGHLDIPTEIAGDVVAVMGFDQRPIAKPHYRAAAAPAATDVSYTPAQIAAAYQFPPGDGTGQTIALIELGGGYTDSDIAAYFTSAGIPRTGTLTAVGVDGAANAPDGNPNGADGEVQLDIEVAGAVAPGANIVVYFGPNQGSGFHDAISQAVNDATNNPGIVSISWGGPESTYAQQDLDAIDQALAQAATLGITVCVASGDNGSSDGQTDGKPHVDFPASSPNALACGGTSLPVIGPGAGGTETAWNDGANGGASGGGYSASFAIPSWQSGIVQNSKRGVPDVAGDADPATGYQVSVDGTATVIGGTSAVAPLWAGLVALVNQSIGRRAGFINPLLYQNPTAFTDIVSGNNGAYKAAPGWDPVTGLGSPLGTQILAALQATPAPAAPTS
jgi:kumamolisin